MLVGDDFRFGARRGGDYAMLDAAGQAHGFDVARMNSYEVHGLRVSSSAVRAALAAGDMAQATRLLGRPYSISGHVVHGRKLGRELGASAAAAGDGFRTLNLRFAHARPAASGIFAVRMHGLADAPLAGVASLGVRPTVDASGRVLLEVHCLDWPAGSAPRGATVDSPGWNCCTSCATKRATTTLGELTAAIAADVAHARAYFAAQDLTQDGSGLTHAAVGRQTTRDRI